MLKVYFERGGYAEHVATFENDQLYNELGEALLAQALAWGFDKVTESMEEENV